MRTHTCALALVLIAALAACGAHPSTPPAAASTPPSAPIARIAPTALTAPPAVSGSGAIVRELVSPILTSAPATPSHAITTVFLIVMENHNWSAIYRNPAAPYINDTLLPQASYALRYSNPPGVHPSEPNYLWLEAGTNFGIANDNDPHANHQSTSAHLVSLLTQAGISWKSYQEGIDGTTCPLASAGLYGAKHNPMVFFDDVTGNNDPKSATCLAHVRPYAELAADLQHGTVARYNFITPNLCHDMHGAPQCTTVNGIAAGDAWLSQAAPPILASSAYKQGGLLMITWDEGAVGDGPIGMIVLSPAAKGGGYTTTIGYTHSSTLRTLQAIFGVTPWLGDAAKASDLRDLFQVFP